MEEPHTLLSPVCSISTSMTRSWSIPLLLSPKALGATQAAGRVLPDQGIAGQRGRESVCETRPGLEEARSCPGWFAVAGQTWR